MGMSLNDILAQAQDRAHVRMTLVSNEEDGICSYAVGDLLFRAETGGQVIGGPRLKQAHMESIPGDPLKFYLSDRMLNIDPPPAPGALPAGPRQPFNANALEPLGVSLTFTESLVARPNSPWTSGASCSSGWGQRLAPQRAPCM
jgi:hypothetical protein